MPIDQQVPEALPARGRLAPAVVDALREVANALARSRGSRRRSRAWAPARARAASSGRPCASRPGWRARPARARPSRRRRDRSGVSAPGAPPRRSPCGSGPGGSRATARRAAGSGSAARGRGGSWSPQRHSVKRSRAIARSFGPSDTRRDMREGMTHKKLLLLAALLAGSCGGGSPTAPTPTTSSSSSAACTTSGQVTFVRDDAPVLLLLVQGAARSRPAGFASPEAYLDAVRYQHARQHLQLHHSTGRERRLLLGQPVHRLRPRLQADGRPRAAAHADVPRQPRGRGGLDRGALPGVDRRQAGRRPHLAPARSARSSAPSRSATRPRSRGGRREAPSGARRSPSGW